MDGWRGGECSGVSGDLDGGVMIGLCFTFFGESQAILEDLRKIETL